MTTETAKPNYKATLNLPKTDFAMKANLAQNEPLSLKRWEQMKLYVQAVEAADSGGRPSFVFHDGPPYANGSIHVGHLLNKVLKDFVVRSRLMMGFQCRYTPGWDCHGLPIEHKVMTEHFAPGSEKARKIEALPDDQRRMAVRRECAKYADKYVKLQAGQMKRLLTRADYDDPYLTMEPRYERAVLEVFADLIEQGLVYRALKPVHWSIANQTALAEAELEYEDREDLSIYVDFEAADREAVLRAFGGVELDQNPSFMIWTTTPWTLPANLAIAVHEKFRYSLVKVDGNVTVIASDLVERVTKAAKAESVEVLAETDGRNLMGLKYRHPFVIGGTGVSPVQQSMNGRDARSTDIWRIVAADYVTLEDGTGLVHTAPGHGTEDYQTGLREKLPIYCSVRSDGTFDDTAPEWLRGVSVWDANQEITDHLRDSGHLFFSHRFTHSYPHDWRSKTPVIFRATEQWFVGVDQPMRDVHRLQSVGVDGAATLRSLALRAADSQITFYPDWGRNRLRGMLESRPDWCISRQRSWGLPIPAFYGSEIGQVLLTPASVRAVAKLFGEKGSDLWFQSDAQTLLTHYDPKNDSDAPSWVRTGHLSGQSGSVSTLTKSADIFDVWFEAGSSWNAVLRARQHEFPADLYLEGSDQHRGWFQLSLLPSLGATGQSPFKSLLTHGFTVDKDGKKMSKSLGNTIEVEDLLKNYGADVCRWWVSSLAFENDIKMDTAYLDAAGETYRKVRNTLRFLLSNLYDFSQSGGTGVSAVLTSVSPTSIDGYILQQAGQLRSEVIAAYEIYEFRRANQLLYDFCNDTLSAFYCAAVKDRLYCDRADSPRRRTTQGVMRQLMELLCRLLAPIMPHTADEAFRALHKDESKTVQLATVNDVVFEFTADADWPAVLVAREAAQKALEEAKARGIDNPLDAEVVLPDSEGLLRKFLPDLPDILGVSRVKLIATGPVSVNDLRSEPRCERSWKRDGTVKQRSDGGMLCDRCAEAVGV
jgi:isoleucyl-tRNA synthetase